MDALDIQRQPTHSQQADQWHLARHARWCPVFVPNYIAYLTISCGGSVLCGITSNR